MIHLRTLIDALEVQGEEVKSYLHRQTGEVVTLSMEELSAAEDGAEITEFPEWQQEAIRTAIDVLATDHYVQLPDQEEIHEWSIMRDFCDAVQDEQVRDELLRAIHGKGAFRYFKDRLYRHHLDKRWHRFKEEALQRLAQRWLKENNLAYDEGA